ncbi:MAG: hypothetical protein EPO10_23265 [Reyranella sp.]|uniref:hypothetical protein n=1 Tax=Reyranella sp. TaxID=1929291 RepID=UPI0011FACB3F|nr:hypothetical protein [Reyranella sp.]TAJ96409.1 MAG: hypothetical protein EPO41_06715 [Reyranella sp.]TBR26240.1 MAG: hypothetical protein EPO10_23265 [Reyranella sp.]
MKRRIWTAVGLALIVYATAGAGQAQQLKNENLLVGVPQGFKLGFKDSKNGMNMQEFVPAAETVQNWTEMVTVQVFLSRKDLEPSQFLALMQKQWAEACKGSTLTPVASGKVNGYESATVLLRCPLLASTGKPETTMLKAIKGNDSFYVVQRAVRSVPTPERLETMKKYIESVSVCDSRLPSRPCPTVK